MDPAVVVVASRRRGHGQGDGTSEPEDRGKGVEDQGGQFMEPAGHVNGHNTDVGQHEKRPDRVEHHEVEAVKRPVVVGAHDCEDVISMGPLLHNGWFIGRNLRHAVIISSMSAKRAATPWTMGRKPMAIVTEVR